MTQFASTLYPQTNPSNPILLMVREDQKRSRYPINYSLEVELLYLHIHEGAAHDHARRVLTRLANLTG